MNSFPANSHRANNPRPEPNTSKKVEKVAVGDVVRRKRSLGKRFKETFVGGNAKGVWEYVTLDVLIPAAKNMFADAFSEGMERMIFGESRSSSRRGGYRPGSQGGNGYVSYNRYSASSPRQEERTPTVSRRGRAAHDFDEIILGTRVEAEEVIDRLFDLVSQYELATVADLYTLVGVAGHYTDEKWGWTSLPGAGVTHVRNGYLLDLPKPEPID